MAIIMQFTTFTMYNTTDYYSSPGKVENLQPQIKTIDISNCKKRHCNITKKYNQNFATDLFGLIRGPHNHLNLKRQT